MVLDLGALFRGEVRVIPFEYEMTPPEIPDVDFSGPVLIVGQVTDHGGYKKLSCHVSAPFVTPCARCLAEVKDTFEFDFERTVALRKNLTEEQLEDEGVEYLIPEAGKVDPDNDIRDEMMMIFPMRLLCTEDCPGLCPKCGKPIRSGLCHCTDEKEIDPRMAILSELLKKAPDGDDDSSIK